MWLYGLNWEFPGQRQLTDACECGNDHPAYVKWWNFFTCCKLISSSRRNLLRGVSMYVVYLR